MSADQDHGKAMRRARVRHSSAVIDADAARQAAVEAAGRALARAQREHDEAVAAAERVRGEAVGQAVAERDRVAAEALSRWSDGVRAELGVPAQAFLRRSAAGVLYAHEAPGTPQVAAAHWSGDGWTVDGPWGRAFVGDELGARRMLWQAVVAQVREIEGSVTA